ncbi:hypothetical protein EJ04DRAFT_62505 [Polyplosphaeria fusca]|uniref:ZZ-type domain-containing protein n=1 Tax=Polyplosphaeria fusca TaxID=682080 RepID=A0A9P4V519_9PLEO|nr:hypothetical protein EJ04DRAFT_62505 [Polyplosphaeria fusca]
MQPTIVKTEEPVWEWSLYDIASTHKNLALVAEDGTPLHPVLAKALAEPRSFDDVGKPQEMLKQTNAVCDGCHFAYERVIRGPAFHCDECQDFDYCFMCKLTAHLSHPHDSWTIREAQIGKQRLDYNSLQRTRSFWLTMQQMNLF